MNYISAKRKKNSTLRSALVVLGILLVVFFHKPILSMFGGGASAVATPVWTAGQLLDGEITEGVLSFHSKKTLVKKFLQLQDDFMSLSAIHLENQVLLSQNDDLKNALSLSQKFGYAHTARVVARPPQISYDTIRIDQGGKDGFYEGANVFSGENIFIGVVKEVYPASSLVQLISSSEIETEARLISTDLSLTLVGRGGGTFSVDVPRDVLINENDVFVSVQSGNFLIAEVVQVTGNPQDPSKTVLARSPINMNYLNYVFIK